MNAPSDGQVDRVLCGELGKLPVKGAFTMVEFTVGAMTIFELSRDQHGTPSAHEWKYTYQNGAVQVTEQNRWSALLADPRELYRRVSPRFVVRPPGLLPEGLRDLLPDPRWVPVYECRVPLQRSLRAAITESPLLLGYELAVLKRVPSTPHRAAWFDLTGLPLFPPGSTAGCSVSVPVRCEPTDSAGTAFAVVTRELRPDLPRRDRLMRPLQIQAATVPPGRYDLTVELVRPGQVQFSGLPVPVGGCRRSWADLSQLVPADLPGQLPVHLVCLVETCGGDVLLKQRIHRLEELIIQAQAGAGSLHVSVITYGAHGVAWRVPDKPPESQIWAVSGRAAIGALRRLTAGPVDKREYPHAAQLECALQLAYAKLAPQHGRPVIVTAGGRAPHPPGLDISGQLIACPERVDVAAELGRLSALPGVTFGALRDPQYQGGVWEQLGRHARDTVDDAVDMEEFAAGLGLLADAQTVPFPVTES